MSTREDTVFLDEEIEGVLSVVSDLGWSAGYLTYASQSAWRLVCSGPGNTDPAMRWALRRLVSSCAMRGWWPHEDNVDNDLGHQRYRRVPLAEQHSRCPVEGLPPSATVDELRHALAALWDTDIPREQEQPTSEQELTTPQALEGLVTTLAGWLGGVHASLLPTDNSTGSSFCDVLIEISHELHTANELRVLQMLSRWTQSQRMTFRAIAQHHGIDPEEPGDTESGTPFTARADEQPALRPLGPEGDVE